MRAASLALAPCLLALSSSALRVRRDNDTNPPWLKHADSFVVDLDLPPMDRWKNLTLRYKETLPKVLSRLSKHVLGPMADGLNRSDITPYHNIPDEYMAELVGIAKWANHSEVTVERLIWWNLMYEMAFPSACSGIIAADKNGMVIHSRNLDTDIGWNVRGKRMGFEDLTVDIMFMKDGEPLFNNIAFIFQIGVHTGMAFRHNKTQSWSLQQDTRFTSEYAGNLEAAKMGGQPYSFFVRSIMENRNLDFKGAVTEVTRAKIMSPCYFIVAGGGPWEGAVIALDRATHARTLNNVQVLSKAIGRWFIVQTNDDLWFDAIDVRRPTGVAFMHDLGQENVNVENVVVTMRTWPLFNPNTLVTYTTIPSLGYHRTVMASESLLAMSLSRKQVALRGQKQLMPMMGRSEWWLGQ